MIGPAKSRLASIAKQHVEDISGINGLLAGSICVLLEPGVNSGGDIVKNKANRFAKMFEKNESNIFFMKLFEDLEEPDQFVSRIVWLEGLVERAESVLRFIFDFGPRNAMQRYHAQSAALSRFHGTLRGPKSPLPDLANHWRQQASLRHIPTAQEGAHP